MVHHADLLHGLVDENNKVNFYDGQGSGGGSPPAKSSFKYSPEQYLDGRGRTRRALDYLKFRLPEEGGLERVVTARERRVPGDAPVAAQRFGRHGHTKGPRGYDEMFKILRR